MLATFQRKRQRGSLPHAFDSHDQEERETNTNKMSTENTETKTPTPRTDAQERLIKANYFHGNIVSPAFARELETELAAAQAQIVGYRDALDECRTRAKKIERAINNGEEGIPHEVCEIYCAANAALVAPAPLVVSRSNLVDAQAQNLALREALEAAYAAMNHMGETLNKVHNAAFHKVRAALSAPPPPVVSREEHERVVKLERTQSFCAGWTAFYTAQAGLSTPRRDEALAAHEARKGGK